MSLSHSSGCLKLSFSKREFSNFKKINGLFNTIGQFRINFSESKKYNQRRNFSSNQSFASHNENTNSVKQFDILVIGGGMVGASLACALGSTPISSRQKIGVIENTPVPKLDKLSKFPDLRVSAVNTSSVELFKAIGVWEDMLGARVSPFYNMEVWDSAGPGSIQFNNATESKTEPLGYMIENNIMQASLFKRMQSLPNIEIFCPSSVESIQFAKDQSDDWVNVTLKDGSKIRARLVVGADGGDSIVRKEAGIPTLGWSYNQKGIVAVVEHKEPNYTAWQRFLPYGPIALLPMHDNYSNIVWSTIPSQVDGLLSLSDEQFLHELRKAFNSRTDASVMFNLDKYLPRLPVPFPELAPAAPKPPQIERIVGKRAAFPLRLTHATEYVKQRLAIIGDAAHTVHPLAGQGVNLGFADVATLATILIEGIKTGQDIGSTVVLKNYQDQRMSSNLLMMTGIEGLKRLFDSSFMPFALARNVGLSITNALSPVKQQIMKFAMGSAVDVTKIGSKKPQVRHTTVRTEIQEETVIVGTEKPQVQVTASYRASK